MKGIIKDALEKYDQKQKEKCETDCAVCFGILVESALLPCRHRFCIQCTKDIMSRNRLCPLCRAEIPSYFKCRFYHANVDKEF